MTEEQNRTEQLLVRMRQMKINIQGRFCLVEAQLIWDIIHYWRSLFTFALSTLEAVKQCGWEDFCVFIFVTIFIHPNIREAQLKNEMP